MIFLLLSNIDDDDDDDEGSDEDDEAIEIIKFVTIISIRSRSYIMEFEFNLEFDVLIKFNLALLR